MKIVDRLHRFRNAAAINDLRPVSPTELTALGCAIFKNSANCIFEHHARCLSPVIADSPRVFFGAHSYMNDGGYSRSNVFVGRFCSIGRRVTLGAGCHSLSGLSTSPALRPLVPHPYSQEQVSMLGTATRKRGRDTVILNDVWIGDGAIIMPGVTISTGAVIGANSIVSKDIPPYMIAAGSPCIVKRQRFSDQIVSGLLNSEWWEYPVEVLKSLPTDNVFDFLEIFDVVKRTINPANRQGICGMILEWKKKMPASSAQSNKRRSAR